MGGFDISLFNKSYTNAIGDITRRMQQPKNEPAQPQAADAQNARPRNAPADVADKIARLVKNVPLDKGAVTLDELKDVKRGRLPKALKAAYAEATTLVKAAQESLSAVGKLKGAELADAFLLHGESKTHEELKDQLQKDYDSLKDFIKNEVPSETWSKLEALHGLKTGEELDKLFRATTEEELATLDNETKQVLTALDGKTRDKLVTLNQLEGKLDEVEKKLEQELAPRQSHLTQAEKKIASENWNALEKAIADQENLSAKLLEMLNATSDVVTKDMLETLMIRADSRASELSTLILQMTELAEEDAQKQAADAPARDEIKTRSAESLMSDMSVAMHDNLEAAAALVSDDNLGVNALMDTFEKLDDYTAPLPEKVKDGTPSQADLLSQFSEAEKALTTLRATKPTKKGSTAKNPNPGRMDAPLVRNIRTGLERIKNRVEVTARRKRTELHLRTFGTSLEASANIRRTYFWEYLTAKSQKIAAFDSALEKLLTSSENLAYEASSDNIKAFRKAKKAFLDITGLDGKNSKNAEDLKNELDTLLNKQRFTTNSTIMKAFTRNADAHPQKVMDADDEFLKSRSTPNPLKELLKDLGICSDARDNKTFVGELGQMERYASQMTDKTFKSAFKQNGVSGTDLKRLILNQPLSGIIEARVYGEDAPAEMFETECLDEFITDKKELGEGSANTAWLVTYKFPDGRIEQRVFKDEISDYVGSDSLFLANDAWKSTHQMVKLNYAAAETANILGTPNVVTKVKAAMCEGSYGVLMTVAPGCSACDLVGSINTNASGQTRSHTAALLADIKTNGYNSNNANQRRFVGSLAKGTCDLCWNDIITGQGDRHDENYFTSMDSEGKAVVTGIDNDMCFPAYKTGLLTYHLEGDNLKNFEKDLLDYYEGPVDTPDKEKIAEILKGAGIKKSNGAINLTITDTTPANIRAALRNGVGVWSGAVIPPFISRTMHDNLLNKANQKRMKDIWKKTLDDASYKAAVNRLDEAVKYVSKMAPEKILDDDDWGNPEVIKEITRSNPVANLPDADNCDGAYEDAETISSNLLERDFSKFFEDIV